MEKEKECHRFCERSLLLFLRDAFDVITSACFGVLVCERYKLTSCCLPLKKNKTEAVSLAKKRKKHRNGALEARWQTLYILKKNNNNNTKKKRKNLIRLQP